MVSCSPPVQIPSSLSVSISPCPSTASVASLSSAAPRPPASPSPSFVLPHHALLPLPPPQGYKRSEGRKRPLLRECGPTIIPQTPASEGHVRLVRAHYNPYPVMRPAHRPLLAPLPLQLANQDVSLEACEASSTCQRTSPQTLPLPIAPSRFLERFATTKRC